MSVFNVFTLFLGFLALMTAPQAASAAGKLSFDQKVGESSAQNLGHYFEATLGKNPETMSIATADLNEDGLNEFIVRDKSCDTLKQACDFKILSESHDKVIVLGEIPAHNLALGNQYTQGVRSLLAFKNGTNDYEYVVYVWEPTRGQYIMTEQK